MEKNVEFSTLLQSYYRFQQTERTQIIPGHVSVHPRLLIPGKSCDKNSFLILKNTQKYKFQIMVSTVKGKEEEEIPRMN